MQHNLFTFVGSVLKQWAGAFPLNCVNGKFYKWISDGKSKSNRFM